MSAWGHILVVDDDADIAQLLVQTLEREGLAVSAVGNAAAAQEVLAHAPIDLVILDVMMPEVDGLELCQRIRAHSDVTILFLSARSEELDQLLGFALGADDYLAKPFRPRELAARVKARVRRIKGGLRQGRRPLPQDSLKVGDCELNTKTHKATLATVPLQLTPKEFAILELLARHPGEPISTQQLFETLWQLPYDASAANAVMVHIRHLRQKFDAVPRAEARIETVWGVGYKLVESPS